MTRPERPSEWLKISASDWFTNFMILVNQSQWKVVN